jgi:hypothetical protein
MYNWEVTRVAVYDTEEPYDFIRHDVYAVNTETGFVFQGTYSNFNLLVKNLWLDSDDNSVVAPGDVQSLSAVSWANKFVIVNKSAADTLTFQVSFDDSNFVTITTVAAGAVKELYLPFGASTVKLTTAGTASTGRILASYVFSPEIMYNSQLITKVGSGTVLTKAVQADHVTVANHGAGTLTLQLSYDGTNYFDNGTIASGAVFAFDSGYASNMRLITDGNVTCRVFSYKA